MARCSICHTLIQSTEPLTSCSECHQEYHELCWAGVGGCATYGCSAAAVAEKPPPAVNVGAGWGDEKTCPSCGKQVASSLLLCRCGATYPYADPMTAVEYQVWLGEEDRRRGSRRTLVVLFLLSLLAIPAPLLGPWAGYHAWSNKDEMVGANGAYLALGYGTAVLGVTYLFVFLLIFMGK